MSATEIAGCDRFRLEVHAERGTVWLRTERGPAAICAPEVTGETGWVAPRLEAAPLGRRHHRHWLDIVRGDAPRDDAALSGLRSMEVAEAIYRSSLEGRWLGHSGSGGGRRRMLRIAMLGVRHYHANFWTRAVQQSPDAGVSGIWDPDPERAAAFAAEYGLRPEADLAPLIDSSDAVAICSATADHRMLIEAAATRGKSVLCEKPLGLDLGRRARDPERRRDLRHPLHAELPQALRSGQSRDPRSARRRRPSGKSPCAGSGTATATVSIRSSGASGSSIPRARAAARCSTRGFTRPISCAWMFGMPISVSATISNAALGLAVEDAAFAAFTLQCGVIAEIATSWTFAAADTSIEIYGTEGSILLGGVDIASRPTRQDAFLRVFRRDGEGDAWTASPIVPHFKTGVFHEHVAWAFIAALRSGDSMPVTLQDGITAQAMIDAAYRSARSGRREGVGA